MGLFSRSAKQPEPVKRKYAPNPMYKARNAFTSVDVDRLLQGWDTTSETIDHYLRSELRQMRARSRKMVRANPYGKRFVQTIKANVIGPNGVNFQAQSVRLNGELDTPANSAIEQAFAEWGSAHCDRKQQLSWVDMQNLALSSAAQDGEFIFRKWYSGPHGFQLELIDAELLDVEKNQFTKSGGEIRLGVEYV